MDFRGREMTIVGDATQIVVRAGNGAFEFLESGKRARGLRDGMNA